MCRVHEAPANVSHDDAMDIDDVIPVAQSPLSLLNAARSAGPFSLLDSNFGRSIFENDPLMPRPPSFVSHPREVRQIPIEVKDSSEPSERSRDAPTIEDVTETAHVQAPATQGTVIIDEESDDDIPFAPTTRSSEVIPAGPAPDNIQDYNDIEEEMIRAAIEASKMEAEVSFSKRMGSILVCLLVYLGLSVEQNFNCFIGINSSFACREAV